MRRIHLLPMFGWLPLFLSGCPTGPNQNNYDYLRSPLTFRIDTVATAHPFCSEGQTPFPTADSCLAARKYALRWERPEDTTGLYEYRIYLDTAPASPGSGGKTWNEVRQDRTLASAIVLGSGGATDSLLFIFNNTGDAVRETPQDGKRIVAFDTSGRIDGQGRLVFAIVAAYRAPKSNGQPAYTWVITNDRFAPLAPQPRYTPYDRRIEIEWARPQDRTSFFDPGADSGVIREYIVRVTRGGILNINRSASFHPQLQFLSGGIDRSDLVHADSFTTTRKAPGFKFTLPDSEHVFNDRFSDPRDSLKAILSGLTPQDTVDISLWAIDASGNATDTTLVTRIILTDTTEPIMPALRLIPESVTRNQFVYAFTASRDRVERDGVLVPGDSQNANILEYRLKRRLISGSTGGSASRDTILTVKAANRRDSLFIDTVRYLPPGSTYRIFVQAVDSSGHLSPPDSLDVSTLDLGFTGPDTGSTCLSGFTPVPAATFMLGDSSATADADEKYGTPSRRRLIDSYCIETYEHRDSTGAFQTRMTWQQAESACLDLSPADNTHLCTEAEWERACEGSDSLPLIYGFQSENPNNPNAVLNACNIGTGDSVMALTQSLRDPTCLTREGVFDMSGNLAEWVRDPYLSNAYSQAKDTLIPGQTLAPRSDSGTHVFRGNHYLNPHLPSTTKLHLARCSNRDYPRQSRPSAYAGCLDSSQPLVVLTYASLQPRCLPIPDSLRGRNITTVSPSRDSTKILFLIEGQAQPVSYTLPAPANPAYLTARALDAKFTPRALAAVMFENSQNGDVVADTLDATEMTDTSEATLSAIFNREASPPWSVHKENGRYVVHFLYAYTQLHGIPARRHYSNAAIGFRCCSLPRRPE